jgi:LETM1 and EF-hand domain-containing protein 1
MSFNRATTRAVAPFLLQHSLRGGRNIPSKVPAIALLLPRRALTTDTSRPSERGGSGPPPGFNIDKAKQPLPKDQAKAKDAAPAASKPADQISISKDAATALPKTDGVEVHSTTELAAGKDSTQKMDEKTLAKKKEEEKKLTLWSKVKREAAHYWDGTKLLAAEVRISSRLALKMAAGYELTRRENRQVSRPYTDLLRSHAN